MLSCIFVSLIIILLPRVSINRLHLHAVSAFLSSARPLFRHSSTLPNASPRLEGWWRLPSFLHLFLSFPSPPLCLDVPPTLLSFPLGHCPSLRKKVRLVLQRPMRSFIQNKIASLSY
ncbi:hypothetical protein LZ31DRAFT_148070 [Colletotrichum somersetense]|nr:hypothetical protein LZ31DRAFT_148070 [Colletotrichum somersetense]